MHLRIKLNTYWKPLRSKLTVQRNCLPADYCTRKQSHNTSSQNIISNIYQINQKIYCNGHTNSQYSRLLSWMSESKLMLTSALYWSRKQFEPLWSHEGGS